ncbi:MAG: phosphotransferase [Sneathiella sp.]
MLKTQSPPASTKLNIASALGKSDQFDGINPELWIIEGPVIRARRSEIYRASHPNFHTRLCIKNSKVGERSTKSLKQEYANLKNFSQAMIDTPFNVPRPIACIPEAGLLVMEWVNGKSVKFELNKRFKEPKSRQVLIKKAARWLKEFHLKGDIKTEKLVPQALTDQINTYRLNNPISFHSIDIIVIKACERFYREAEQIPVTQEQYSFAHRDFTPGNVIICDTSVLGIDMTQNIRRPVFEDLTRFLVDLNVNKSIFLVGLQILFPSPRGWLLRDERTILTEYLGDKAQEKNKQVLLFLIMHTIKKMIQAAEIVSTHRQTIGLKSPFLLLYRYVRYWKRRMLLLDLYRRLK